MTHPNAAGKQSEIEQDFFAAVDGLCRERKWTETTLLDQAQIEPQLFNDFRSGLVPIDLNSMDKLSKALGVPLPEMLEYQPFSDFRSIPRIRKDIRKQLLLEIESRRIQAGLSLEELRERLQPLAERPLAAYVIGNELLSTNDIETIGHVMEIDGKTLALKWARSLGLIVAPSKALEEMRSVAFHYCQESGGHSMVPRISFQDVIRIKYKKQLSIRPPKPWPPSRFADRCSSAEKQKLDRGYKMLVKAVHEGKSAKALAAEERMSDTTARSLMTHAAYVWAASQGLDLIKDIREMPRAKDKLYIKKLYRALEAISQPTRTKQRELMPLALIRSRSIASENSSTSRGLYRQRNSRRD
jgi:transcriptional regulator with XRE-family HTH domain